MPSKSPNDDQRPTQEQATDRNVRSTDTDEQSNDIDGRSTDTDGPSTDDLVDALQHRHRRHALSVLEKAGSEYTVGGLAREITERLPDGSDDRALSERSLAVRLYHVHLPKLADVGLVEFDATTRRVSATTTASSSSDGSDTVDTDALDAIFGSGSGGLSPTFRFRYTPGAASRSGVAERSRS